MKPHPRPIRTAIACLVLVLGRAASGFAEKDLGDQVSFYRQVRPIFQAHCYGCHQPAKRGGELDMTTIEGLLTGGESAEPAIVPRKPAAGTLLAMVSPGDNQQAEMPKGRPALSGQQIALIRSWIEQGAQDDSPPSPAAEYTAEHPPIYPRPTVISALDFSPDGSRLAVSGYHEVLLLTADGSRIVARLVGMSPRIESIAFSPNGKRLAVSGGAPGRFGELQIWDVATRELQHSIVATLDTLFGAGWSPDGRLVSFGGTDATLRAVDAGTGQQVFFQKAHDDWVVDSAFSVDSSHLLSVSRDRSIKLNAVATQRFVDNITSTSQATLKGELQAVDRHPVRDELLVGGTDGIPRIYRLHRDKGSEKRDDVNLLRKFPPMPGRVLDVRYSSDGELVAAGSSSDGQGHVWVFAEKDAKLVAKMEGLQGGVYRVAFAADGKTIASGGFDGRVFLNDPSTGKFIKSFVPVPLDKEETAAGK